MLRLAIRFDLGRYHATPWGAHVNEGTVEWPPSPWRLLRALRAVGWQDLGLRTRREPLDQALAALARAAPPGYVLPPSRPGHTRHFVPSRTWSPLRAGETDLLLDGFRAMDPQAPIEVWWDVELAPEPLRALQAAAEAVGYLGRSESVCRAQVDVAAAPPHFDAVPVEAVEVTGERAWDTVELLAPTADADLAVLDASVVDLRRQRLRLPPGTRYVTYALAEPEMDGAPVGPPTRGGEAPTLAVFRVSGGARPSVHHAVLAGEALRTAAQSRFGKRNGGAASSVLSGRDGERPRGDQHRHAHYLSWADRGSSRIDHVAVWAPEGLGPAEVAALAGVDHLRWYGLPEPLDVALTALGHPGTLRVPEVAGRARAWRSRTPFALVRHPKRRGRRVVDGPIDQVRRELEVRGLPAPEHVELLRGRWHEFRRTRSAVSRLRAPDVVGVRLRFADPVAGPLALGGLSHFGLGLFAPEGLTER